MLSKLEYWKKWELSELIDDLQAAKKILDETNHSPKSSEFKTKEDFSEALADEMDEIEHWNGSPIYDFIYNWFSPTSTWSEFVNGEAGELIRERIFGRIKKWKEGTAYKAE
jgi:hypothetical protein